jgi:hypothetical protein
LALLISVFGVAACDDGGGSGTETSSGSKLPARPAQSIESPIGDFVVQLPAGFSEPLWKSRGPTDVNFAASSGKRTVEVRSSPNVAKGSELLSTEGVFRVACNAVESSKANVVDFSKDLEVDGQMARIYHTHPADPNKTGAVKMMFVASAERFYAVSMAAPSQAEFEGADAKAFFDSFHVKSPAIAQPEKPSP